jgi:integrase
MARKRISKTSVDALQCKSGQDRAFVWDDALSGFGVCALPSGRKVFVAQFRQNGRSRRIALGDYGRLTPDEARSSAKKVLGAVEGGADPIQERRAGRAVRTFREVSEEFIRLHVSAKRKSATKTQYERFLAAYINPTIGSRRLTDIRRVDVARLHAALSDRPPTANRCIAVISSIWNWAARRDEIAASANPAIGIDRNPEHAKERFLSSEELGRLGDALRRAETEGLPWKKTSETKPTAKHIPKGPNVQRIDPHAAAAIRLLILTGARLREILNAKWAYVDWERGIMFLPDSKTGRKPVYLSAAALAVLKDVPRVASNPYIIPGDRRPKKRGEPKPPPSYRADLKRPWEAVARAAGFVEQVQDVDAAGKPMIKSGKPVMIERTTVRLHDLRHSFASFGAGASLGLPIIGKLLGHSQPATTARYSHLDADPMHRAVDIIGNRIAAAMAGKSAEVVQIDAGRRK